MPSEPCSWRRTAKTPSPTLAGIYKSAGQLDKARALLEDAVKRIPQTVDLRLALAQLYASQGQEPQVEALLIDLVRLRPNEPAHRLEAGAVLRTLESHRRV